MNRTIATALLVVAMGILPGPALADTPASQPDEKVVFKTISQPGQTWLLKYRFRANMKMVLDGQPLEIKPETVFEMPLGISTTQPGGPSQIVLTIRDASIRVTHGEEVLQNENAGKLSDAAKLMIGIKLTGQLGPDGQVVRFTGGEEMIIRAAGGRRIDWTNPALLRLMETFEAEQVGMVNALTAYLPRSPVAMGQSWQVKRRVFSRSFGDVDGDVRETTDCRLERIIEEKGRRLAVISLSGTCVRVAADGSDQPVQFSLSGEVRYDLASARWITHHVECKWNEKGRLSPKGLITSMDFSVDTSLEPAAPGDK